MRKVKVFKYEKKSGDTFMSKVEDGEAMFHQFGMDYEEFDNGAGNFSTAIIEREGGKVENVRVEMVEFIDEREMHTMEQDTFDWWGSYIRKEQDLQNRAKELKGSLDNDDSEKFEQELIDAGDNDMQMMQMSQASIIEAWESK